LKRSQPAVFAANKNAGVDVEIAALLFGRLESRFLLRGNTLRRV
jgi:hypothetical protein